MINENSLKMHGKSKHNSDVPRSATGTFAGNNTQNRAIAHGLGVKPRMVLITHGNISYSVGVIQTTGVAAKARAWLNSADYTYDPTDFDTTNFYVGSATPFYLNEGGITYVWTAIS